jgi:group I intron endonuclease
MMCIYSIQNLINHKVYIGSAFNLKVRWKHHVSDLSRQVHVNPHLQRAWNKFGEKNFVCWSLEEVTNKNHLIKREQFYLDQFKGYSFGLYNICTLAGSHLGLKRSEATRLKLSAVAKGNQNWLGKRHLEESKQKMSEANKGNQYHTGFKHSEGTKRLMSEARRKFWEFKRGVKLI